MNSGNIRIPAEWEPHAFCLMAWAVHQEWGASVDNVKRELREVISTVAEYEPVRLLVPPDLAAAALTQATLRRQAVAKFGDGANRLFFTWAATPGQPNTLPATPPASGGTATTAAQGYLACQRRGPRTCCRRPAIEIGRVEYRCE